MGEPVRNTDPSYLHPLFRAKARELLELLELEGIPFRLFEGYRSPDRQQYLYAQGRTRPGKIVTRARPCQSYHQYGLAGDFVLFVNGKWSWETLGASAGHWRRLHEAGKRLGLEPLSFELPHLQAAGLRIADLAASRYPVGGDASWESAVRRPQAA